MCRSYSQPFSRVMRSLVDDPPSVPRRLVFRLASHPNTSAITDVFTPGVALTNVVARVLITRVAATTCVPDSAKRPSLVLWNQGVNGQRQLAPVDELEAGPPVPLGNRRSSILGKPAMWLGPVSPLVRFGSDLTNTIRARGQQGLHPNLDALTASDRMPVDRRTIRTPSRSRAHGRPWPSWLRTGIPRSGGGAAARPSERGRG